MAKKLSLFLIFSLNSLFLINMALCALSFYGKGIFQHKIGDILNQHYIQAQPANWAHFIWILIFIFLGISFIFLSVITVQNLDKEEDEGKHFVPKFNIFTNNMCFLLSLNFLLLSAWLFLFDNKLLADSFIISLCVVFVSCTTISLFSIRLSDKEKNLEKRGKGKLLLCYYLVQNSLGAYIAWTVNCSLLNFGQSLIFDNLWKGSNLRDPGPSLAVIAILAIIIAIWVPLETIVWDRYFRYLLSPHLVIAWSLNGTYQRLKENKAEGDDHSVKHYVATLLGVVIILLVARVFLTIQRSRVSRNKNQNINKSREIKITDI